MNVGRVAVGGARGVAGLVLVGLLAACATSDAGVPVSTPAVPTPAPSSGGPAPAELVAQAGLEPCLVTETSAAPVSRGLPAVTLPCLGRGPDVHLAGLRGRPTLVNVWASWCVPCRAELPMLGEFASSQSSVRVLGVDALDDPASALSLLIAAGVHYPSARDDLGATKAGAHWGSGLPVTLLVDAQGAVVFEQHGAFADGQQIRDLVATQLKVAS